MCYLTNAWAFSVFQLGMSKMCWEKSRIRKTIGFFGPNPYRNWVRHVSPSGFRSVHCQHFHVIFEGKQHQYILALKYAVQNVFLIQHGYNKFMETYILMGDRIWILSIENSLKFSQVESQPSNMRERK
jgi:hypothetical protein